MAPLRLWIRKSSPGHDHQWRGLSLKDYIIYELHIGTFTQEGTLDSAIAHLPYLKQLGITVIELMPVAAFPGTRNWGYDACRHSRCKPVTAARKLFAALWMRRTNLDSP